MHTTHESLLAALTLVESRAGIQRFLDFLSKGLGDLGVAVLWSERHTQSVYAGLSPQREEELERLRLNDSLWPLLQDNTLLSAPGLTLLAARKGQDVLGALAFITGDDDAPPLSLDKRWEIALTSALRKILRHQQLEDVERRFLSLTQGANIGYLMADRHGQILEVNERLVKLLGSPSAEATLRFNLRTFAPLVSAGVSHHFMRCIDWEEDTGATIPYTSAWGKTVLLHFLFRPLRDSRGRVVGAHGMVDDLTPLEQARSDRARAEEALEQRQRLVALGTLAGGVAHDLNNALASVLGFAEAVQGSGLPPTTEADVREIIAGVLRGRRLTQDLLAFTVAPSPLKETISFHEVIAQVARIFERTTPPGVHTVVELTASRDTVLGDARRLEHAIMNVLLNSLHALRGAGTIFLRTDPVFLPDPRWGDLPDGPYLRCTIQDDGVGMPPDVLRRAMEPFFTTRASGEGTGLGLSQVYGTVRAHYGAMSIESEVDHGTSVFLLFPLVAAEVRPEQAPRLHAHNLEGDVLLIDDDPLVLRAHARMLRQVGLNVRAVEGCKAALAAAAEAPPQVVITDLNMPGLSGIACLTQPGFPQVPVLVVSGFLDVPLGAPPPGIPAVAFLHKPFTLDELCAALEQLLSKGN